LDAFRLLLEATLKDGSVQLDTVAIWQEREPAVWTISLTKECDEEELDDDFFNAMRKNQIQR
jgi:hypothetical protein